MARRLKKSRVPALFMLIAPLAAGTVGCVSIGGCDYMQANFVETRSQAVPLAEPSPLKVVTRNGSVRVVKASDPELKVSATIRATTAERLAAFIIDVSRDQEGMLFIQPVPPGGEWKNGEGASFEIALPGTTKVHLATTNGAITTKDLEGEATLKTSNGAITIETHAGNVLADSSNGAIKATRLDGLITADTSNGRIEIDLADGVKGPVTLDTSNGSITLSVGAAFAGRVNIDTSNGSITIKAPGNSTIKQGKSDAVIDLPTPGETSVLDTSNGRVTFTVRNAS